jgi:chemotaxis protein MotB
MKFWIAKLTVIVASAASAVGCASGPDPAVFDQMSAERDDLRSKNTDLEGQLAATEAKCSALERELASRRSSEKNDVKLTDEMTNKGVRLSQRNGDTVIDVPSDVFFASGQSTLSRDGERILGEVGSILKKQFPGSVIRIEGHADADPIRSTKGKYHCNWELSFERAHAVAHYLVDKGRLEPARLVCEAHGEHHPAEPGNKAKNRRVEIVLSR